MKESRLSEQYSHNSESQLYRVSNDGNSSFKKRIYKLVKRVTDILLSLVALTVLSPVFL